LKQEERDGRFRDSRAFIRRAERGGYMFYSGYNSRDVALELQSRGEGAVCGLEAKRFATHYEGPSIQERGQDYVHYVCGHPGHDPPTSGS